jgi:adenylate kinase family enzyme
MGVSQGYVLHKVLIFGNSGSGKSTLARNLSVENAAVHLDLDTIAWQATSPPTRTPLIESVDIINEFIMSTESWVIEGCYSDLLKIVIEQADEIIFLNLPVDSCIDNAKNRPWEPHKYDSPEAQNANLNMLINWISQYPQRADTFSQNAHNELFNSFSGKKEMRTKNL